MSNYREDWVLDETVLPEDMNKIGQGLNIFEQTIKKIDDFFENGGDIDDGALSILTDSIRTNKKWIDFHNGKTGIYSPADHRIGLNADGKQVDLMTDSNMPRFEPFHDNEYCLGSENFRWKDMFLSGVSKSINHSGYSKLPNGLIMQWGLFIKEGDEAKTFEIFSPYPIAFPNGILSFVGTVGNADEFTNVRACDYYAEGWNHQFHIRSYTTGENSHTVTVARVNWIAIGC